VPKDEAKMTRFSSGVIGRGAPARWFAMKLLLENSLFPVWKPSDATVCTASDRHLTIRQQGITSSVDTRSEYFAMRQD
jgi:hypothetical protein